MNTIRRVQGMVAIAALAIGVAGVGRAQSNPPAEQKKTAAEKKTEAAPKRATEEAKKKGPGEGIQVHGHWTIEVKDPDGKVATHREFENNLVGGTGSNTGSSFLTELLLGYTSSGGLFVTLVLTPPGGGPSSNVALQTFASGFTCPTNSSTNLCSNTLTAGVFANGLGFSLTGQIIGTQAFPMPAGNITQVFTNGISCFNGSIGVLPVTPTTISPANCTNGTQSVLPAFTSATLTPGTPTPPVPVSAGQTVQVTVQITFM
jgi:hypothetical protein